MAVGTVLRDRDHRRVRVVLWPAVLHHAAGAAQFGRPAGRAVSPPAAATDGVLWLNLATHDFFGD